MPELKLLRRVRVDIDDLEDAFESHDLDVTWYLDVRSGAVLGLTEEDVREARYGNGEPPTERRADAVDRVRRVLGGLGAQYLPIPQDDPADAWQDMAAFTETVSDAALKRRLRGALRGKSAPRRFRDVLSDTVGFEDWHVFQQQRTRGRILEWLASVGVGGFYED
jgi:hypothetical protein